MFFEKTETEDHRGWRSRDQGANLDPGPRPEISKSEVEFEKSARPRQI